jgi:CubicO group peptidase (beta-lactamase class C family)
MARMTKAVTDRSECPEPGLAVGSTAVADALASVSDRVRAAVAVHDAGRTVTFAHGVAEEPVRVGCLAKVLTATLVLRAVSEGHLALDGELPEVLGKRAEALGTVTVRHLLEHTHGLDDSLLHSRPRCGTIDSAELCRRGARLPRLAPPGQLYSYGNIGAWLAAAVLERVSRETYGTLLRRTLLAPLGCEVAAGVPICPATGGDVVMTVGNLVRFAASEMALAAWRRVPTTAAARSITSLPGWNPLERGVLLGWKHAGEGWFGHQSTWPGASIFLRVAPEERRVIVVASRTHPAAVLAQRLFGRALPGLFQLRPPGIAHPMPLTEWAGRYERAATVAEIRIVDGRLVLAAQSRDAASALRRTALALQPAGAVCLAVPPSEAFPFVQLVGDRGWLWNGRVVYRRVA